MKSSNKFRSLLLLSSFAVVILAAGNLHGQLPSGVAAYWPLDGDGQNEAVEADAMSLFGQPAFSAGVSNAGIVFDGINDYGAIPQQHPSAIDIGANESFTAELWIRPTDVSYQQPLLEWSDLATTVGLHLWISVVSPWAGGGPGSLFANLIDRDGVAHHVSSPAQILRTNVFQHVAVTYDGASGIARLYVNGTSVAQTNIGSRQIETRTDLYVGWRIPNYRFTGMMDEVTLHNRALSDTELAEIASRYVSPTNELPQANSFNLARDFGLSNNPAGVWSYGWKEGLGGNFGLLTAPAFPTADNGVVVFGWVLTNQGLPAVYINPTSDTAIIGGGQGVLPPGTVWFHPGWDGRPENFAVIRFTAPSNGNYRVGTAVAPVYSGSLSGDSDFHVLRNGGELFGAFLAPTQSTSFTGVVALASGETIDLALGRGADPAGYGAAVKISATIAFTTDSPPETNAPLPDLVAYWPLDNTGTDASGHGHGITFFGEPVFQAGVSNQALRLDGTNDYGRVERNGDLDELGAGAGLTLELWVKPSELSQEQPLLEWTDRTTVIGVHLWASIGGAGALFANVISRDGVAHHVVSPSGVLRTNEFQHVALTYARSNGMARLYVGGEQVAESDIGSFIPETRTELYVGWRTPSYFFHGAMDEVKLHNHVLSSNEIAQIAAQHPTATPPQVPLGLVSTWHAENNAIDSVGTNNGILINSVHFVPGVIGQAFEFDGASFVRVLDSSSLHLTNELTVQMWFNRDDSFAAAHPLFDKRDLTTCNYGVTMPDYGLVMYYNDPAYADFEKLIAPRPSGGVWHHFAGTYRQLSNSVRMIYFLDGIAVGTNTTPGTLAAAAGDAPLAIGSARDGAAPDHYFKGAIDEVAIYNYALTASQIFSNFNAVTPPVVTNAPPTAPHSIVSLWHAEGNTADSVGTNNGVSVNNVGFGPGIAGQAFQFGGTNFVHVADSPSLRLTNELTVQLWFSRDDSFAAAHPLFDKRDFTTCNYGVTMPDYGLVMYYNDPRYSDFEKLIAPRPTGGVWHHFTGTYRQQNNGVQTIYYLDGASIATNTTPGTLAAAANAAPLAIGSARDGAAPDHYFKGLIDEVAIYNYALSASEVQSNYTAVANYLPITTLVPPQSPTGSGSFGFQLTRGATAPYAVEASTNLVNWSPAQLSTRIVSGATFLIDTNTASFNQRFYRLRFDQ